MIQNTTVARGVMPQRFYGTLLFSRVQTNSNIDHHTPVPVCLLLSPPRSWKPSSECRNPRAVFFSPAGDNDSDRGGGDSDEEEEEERAAFERAVTEVANKVMQDAEKKMGSRGGGVQNAAFESLQVQMCVGVDS